MTRPFLLIFLSHLPLEEDKDFIPGLQGSLRWYGQVHDFELNRPLARNILLELVMRSTIEHRWHLTKLTPASTTQFHRRISDSEGQNFMTPIDSVDLILQAIRMSKSSSPGKDGFDYPYWLLIFNHPEVKSLAT